MKVLPNNKLNIVLLLSLLLAVLLGVLYFYKTPANKLFPIKQEEPRVLTTETEGDLVTVELSPTSDTFITSGNPERVQQNVTGLWVGYDFEGGFKDQVTLIGFDLPEEIKSASVVSAQLFLTLGAVNGSSSSLNTEMLLFSAPWDDNLTWNNYSGLVSDGYLDLQLSYLSTISTNTSDKVKTFDAKNLINRWVEIGSPNNTFSVVIRSTEGNSPLELGFWSSRVEDSRSRPKLIITYSKSGNASDINITPISYLPNNTTTRGYFDGVKPIEYSSQLAVHGWTCNYQDKTHANLTLYATNYLDNENKNCVSTGGEIYCPVKDSKNIAHVERGGDVASICNKSGAGFDFVLPKALHDGKQHKLLVKAQIGNNTPYYLPPSNPNNITVNIPKPVINPNAKTITVCPNNNQSGITCDFIGGEGLQQAINTAPSGSTINIIKGTYAAGNNFILDSNTSDSKRKKWVSIIDKDLTINGNGSTITAKDSTEYMDGFIIVGDSFVSIKSLNIDTFLHPIANTLIDDNSGNYFNEGLCIGLFDSASLELHNSSITNCGSIGVTALGYSVLSIFGSSFIGNGHAESGYMHSLPSNISNATHLYRGISGEDLSKITIYNSIFRNNYGYNIVLMGSSSVEVNNSLLLDPLPGGWKGGYPNNRNIYLASANTVVGVKNSILVNLDATADTQFYATRPDSSITNSIIYGAQGVKATEGEPTISNVTYQDPQFVNYPTDLHLKPTSPGINAGDPSIKDPDGSISDIGLFGGPNACLVDNNLPGCENKGGGDNDTDVNNDGLTNLVDVLTIIQGVFNSSSPSQSLDVNNDGQVNLSDVVKVIQQVFGT